MDPKDLNLIASPGEIVVVRLKGGELDERHAQLPRFLAQRHAIGDEITVSVNDEPAAIYQFDDCPVNRCAVQGTFMPNIPLELTFLRMQNERKTSEEGRNESE